MAMDILSSAIQVANAVRLVIAAYQGTRDKNERWNLQRDHVFLDVGVQVNLR
jgi:hypothetical protein